MFQIELTDHPLILNGITTNIDIVAYLGEFVLKCKLKKSFCSAEEMKKKTFWFLFNFLFLYLTVF